MNLLWKLWERHGLHILRKTSELLYRILALLWNLGQFPQTTNLHLYRSINQIYLWSQKGETVHRAGHLPELTEDCFWYKTGACSVTRSTCNSAPVSWMWSCSLGRDYLPRVEEKDEVKRFIWRHHANSCMWLKMLHEKTNSSEFYTIII